MKTIKVIRSIDISLNKTEMHDIAEILGSFSRHSLEDHLKKAGVNSSRIFRIQENSEKLYALLTEDDVK